ncbi:MAG: holdfast anchor protein HfaD [Pseudomonadota bacterium]
MMLAALIKRSPKRMSLIALAVALAAANASSQAQSSDATIDQVQLQDVWSDMDVHIDDYAWEASSTSTAVGNAAAGLVMSGDVTVQTHQMQDGTVTADNQLTGGSAGLAVATTTAYGNSTTGGTWSGNTYYRADQVANGDVAANTTIDMDGAHTIVSATTAIANVSVPTNEWGTNAAFQTQDSNGSVTATTDVDMCCDGNAASFGTTAGGNAVSATGTTTSNYVGAVQTTAAGETIAAASDVYLGDGHNVLGATTAFGNSATVHNEWGYATLGREGSEVYQENASAIDSQSYVTLDNWSGAATSSAYGVGNATTISNVGSDTGLYANQNNYGSVYSVASFNGGASDGGAGIVTSTAIGNAATATLCNICGDAALHGQTQQYNAGSVIAQGRASVGQTGSVFGSATAVGNSATYQSNGD